MEKSNSNTGSSSWYEDLGRMVAEEFRLKPDGRVDNCCGHVYAQSIDNDGIMVTITSYTVG